MKTILIEDIQKTIQENWEENTIFVSEEVQELIHLEEVQLVDISFYEKRTKDLEDEFELLVLHFQVKGEEIKIDYFIDEHDLYSIEELLPNGLYEIGKNDMTGGDIFHHEKDRPEFLLNYALVETLNFFDIRDIILSLPFELVKEEYIEKKDKEFFELYGDYLKGIKSVKGTVGYNMRIVLESGLSLSVSKQEIDMWLNDEIIIRLKEITKHNYEQIEKANGDISHADDMYTIVKNDVIVYDFIHDEKRVSEVNPVHYYDVQELCKIIKKKDNNKLVVKKEA